MDDEVKQYSSARLVDEPSIERIIDQRIGKEFAADEYVALCRRDIAVIRLEVFSALQEGKSLLRCAACHVPVYPKKFKNAGKFYFSHIGGNDKNCPYREQVSSLRTERIDAMRYNGQKEGPDHIGMKKLLIESINSDPAFDPLLTSVESNWYGITDKSKWRRPDVSAVRKFADGTFLRIAFEVQLSSTYLKVIAARKKFYLEDNALLFWIFKDALIGEPRQYQDDLFYNNNSNLFILDDETLFLSREKRKFILRCRYLEPSFDGNEISEIWREQFVAFDELSIIREKQQVFWFDYAGVKIKAMEESSRTKKKMEAQEIWLSYSGLWVRYHTYDPEFVAWEYEQLKVKLKKNGVIIPDRPNKEFYRFSTLVLSAKEGRPVANGYSNLLEVANYAYDNCKSLLWYFGKVLSHFGHWQRLTDEDKRAAENKRRKGKSHISWFDKKKTIRDGMMRKDPEFEQNRNYDQLFFFLFPELRSAE